VDHTATYESEQGPTPKPSRFSDGIDVISQLAGIAGSLALLAMILFVCFEVVSRGLFNEPTVWVNEYATYLLIAVTFIGLAYAQKEKAHIQVELVLGALRKPARDRLTTLTLWIGLFFLVFAAWQMTSFNYQEYANNTRSWGLLATPQWKPQLMVSVGCCLFCLSFLADLNRKALAVGALRWSLVPSALLALAGFLFILGPYPVKIASGPFDWGSLGILGVFLTAIWAWSGLRTLMEFSGFIGIVMGVFYFGHDLSLLWIGLMLVTAILVFLLAGVPISLGLGSVGLFGLYFLLPSPQLAVLAERSWNGVNSFTLTAIPMFVMMGGLLLRSGATSDMFGVMRRWFGKTPGGIAHASIGACGVFAAVSGSSVATAATMGAVACPEMIERGYSPRLTYGVIAAGGTLGILIPPSIAMIIYGTTVGAPVTTLFIAGIVPGLLLMASFMLVVFIWSLAIPGAAPQGRSYTLSEKVQSTAGVLPFVALIALVLGSLYLGVATPTEAGGIGSVFALLLCLWRGKLTMTMLLETALETVKVTSFLLMIVVGAAILSWVFDALQLPVKLVAQVETLNWQPWLIMAIIGLIYILMGMFIDAISMMLMTLSITFPIVTALGFDPIWFGIALVLLIEVGMITPPVGIILFVLRGISGDVDMKQIVLGVLPFVGVILLNVVLIYFYPSIVTWLPAQME